MNKSFLSALMSISSFLGTSSFLLANVLNEKEREDLKQKWDKNKKKLPYIMKAKEQMVET
jgi:hypothetical protein